MATQYTAGLTSGQILTAATMNSIGAEWEAWTPAVVQNGAVASTNNLGRYTQINKLVIAVARVTITGAGTANNTVTLSLPLTANNNSAQIVGSGFIYDASTNRIDIVAAEVATATTIRFYRNAAPANSFWGIDPNVALASGDSISVSLWYEAD